MATSEIALTALRALVRGNTDAVQEQAVIEIVTSLDAARLGQVCADRDLIGRIIATTQDHGGTDDNRTALIELLAQRRAEIGPAGQAGFIRALVAAPTGAAGKVAIAEMLLGATGPALTELKNRIDAGDDHYDLENLVYSQIGAGPARQTVLAHIATQAKAAGIRDPVTGRSEVKVLSDVDDTALCTLKDDSYPRGVLYPGVLAFWSALDDGPDDRPHSLGDLAFVTARPGDGFGIIEDHLRNRLGERGVGVHSVLTGGFTRLFSHDAMAANKIENIQRFHALYPEYDLVFIGDSGQGDVAVGQAMKRLFPAVTAGVFIHDVSHTPTARRAEHAAGGVVFFDTYVGAALQAQEWGLISLEGLRGVAEQAAAEFKALAGWDSEAQRLAAWRALDRDLARAVGTG